MFKDFVLPDLGEGVVECEVVEWLVAEGERVTEDQPVVEVMTDKALVQIPSPFDGVVDTVYFAKGATAKVDEPLFRLRLNGAATPEDVGSEAQPGHMATNSHQQPDPVSAPNPSEKHKVIASPAVRRMAREAGIELSTINGSGKDGRILKEDLAEQSEVKEVTQPEPESKLKPTLGERVEAISGMRAAMAAKVSRSVAEIPHFTLGDEWDLSGVVALRQQLKAKGSDDSAAITLMPFVIKALSLSLKAFPILNSRINEACTEITYLSEHNIGIAVDGAHGLVVPNIKSVQRLSLSGIASEVSRLTQDGREGHVARTDLIEGTITISNIGSIGGTHANPIIHQPEVAILALGQLRTLPRFDDHGEVVAKQLMPVSWTADHRIIDGATLARCNRLCKSYLERPEQMMMALV